MAQYFTGTSTWPGPGLGVGMSLMEKVRSPSYTAAFMRIPSLLRELDRTPTGGGGRADGWGGMLGGARKEAMMATAAAKSIYDELGVREAINALGFYTMLGGSI